jgi:hypothetical protein
MKSTPFSCQILMKILYSQQIFGKYIPNFMKIRPMGAQLLHADRQMDGRMNGQSGRQTDMTKPSGK